MVGLSEPGEVQNGASTPGSQSDDGVEVGPVVPSGAVDGETVEFFEEERALPEAVGLMAEMLDNPDSFGLAVESEQRDHSDAISQLRDRVDQQERAIADLAEAVEILSEHAGNGSPVVRLKGSAYGDIYTPSTGAGGGESDADTDSKSD